MTLPYFMDDVIKTGRVRKGPTPSKTNTKTAAKDNSDRLATKEKCNVMH